MATGGVGRRVGSGGYGRAGFHSKRRIGRKARLKVAFMAITSILMLGVALAMLYVGILYHREGEFVSQFVSLTDTAAIRATRIVSADGVVLAELTSERREPAKLAEVPEELRNATIAAEDHSFWTHPGIDLRGIGRALFVNVRGGRVEQGASTITQQLARNAYLNQERTFNRKLREMMIAVHIEKRLSKAQILELYLNRIYYGANSYGIKAAARVYFNKDLDDLTLAECALLAGLPQRPSVYAPRRSKDNTAAIRRRNFVLQSMFDEGLIQARGGFTAKQRLDKARSEPLRLASRRHVAVRYKAPYFVTYVLAQLEKQFGTTITESQGWSIETTLRYDMQLVAEQALREMLSRNAYANEGAVILIDVSGRILAMVGGSDFSRNQYNAVTQGLLQPGSAFKPFVYATAFDLDRLTPQSTLEDRPFSRPLGNGKYWRPHNANGRFSGRVSVSSAFIFSINIPAIHALEEAGVGNVIEYAHDRFGFSTPMDPVLSLALGSEEVRPIEMAQGYAVFATGGTRVEPFGIARVTSPDGNVNQELTANVQFDVIRASTAQEINTLARQVVTRGTAAGASGIHSVTNAHGKTGTTSKHIDAWFCGYTDKYVAVVWVANVDRKTGRKRQMPGVFGGNTAAVIWSRLMNSIQAIDYRKAEARDLREGRVVQVRICDESGMVASYACPRTESKKFAKEDAPKALCTTHRARRRTPQPEPPPTEEVTPYIDATPDEMAPPAADTSSPEHPRVQDPSAVEGVGHTSGPTPPPISSSPQTVSVTICVDTGLRANVYCPETVARFFTRGEQPRRVCRTHRQGVR